MSVHSKRSQKARTQIRSHIVKTRNLFEFSSKSIITYCLVYQVLCRRPTEASPKESWNIIYLWNFPILRPLLCCLSPLGVCDFFHVFTIYLLDSHFVPQSIDFLLFNDYTFESIILFYVVIDYTKTQWINHNISRIKEEYIGRKSTLHYWKKNTSSPKTT